ncbi:hypothetical protein CPAR01_00026 [Colletotrichum paranaense]|uniref:Uncharacterized protein n=2 Tax=Colletotrichum acutatum species complex TaxID=2707335 RepID=A0AAI9U3N5_9PEZI|nr:uncharacterized protein CPAR01_00026 [Colletotrichum paranaense]KAK1448956.1 hypothetical protein CMEL01_08271 [Colletotrichum melonis]KAK1546059.1 hypothetical protein CPAR01_00026 [Colletotrichum paranaense]
MVDCIRVLKSFMVSPAHPAFRRHEGFTSDFYSLHYILFTEISLLGKHLISFFLNKFDSIAGCYVDDQLFH